MLQHRPPSSSEPPSLPACPLPSLGSAPSLWKEAAACQFWEYPLFLGLITLSKKEKKTQQQQQLVRLFQPPRCFPQKYLKTTEEVADILFYFLIQSKRRAGSLLSAHLTFTSPAGEKSGAPTIQQKTGKKKKKKKMRKNG